MSTLHYLKVRMFFFVFLQLGFAAIMSAIYALVMMLVIVSIAINISYDGICSPSAIFLFMVAGIFIISAILHPQEFWCLPAGIIYFLSVPCMYLLLVIYSVCNLHVVSWGTREVRAVFLAIVVCCNYTFGGNFRIEKSIAKYFRNGF